MEKLPKLQSAKRLRGLVLIIFIWLLPQNLKGSYYYASLSLLGPAISESQKISSHCARESSSPSPNLPLLPLGADYAALLGHAGHHFLPPPQHKSCKTPNMYMYLEIYTFSYFLFLRRSWLTRQNQMCLILSKILSCQ